jgi:hypothetical protein
MLKDFPARSQEIAHGLADGAPGCQGDATLGYFFFLGGAAGFWFGSATTVAE